VDIFSTVVLAWSAASSMSSPRDPRRVRERKKTGAPIDHDRSRPSRDYSCSLSAMTEMAGELPCHLERVEVKRITT